MSLSARLRFLGATMLGAYIVINALMFVLAPVTQGMPRLGFTAILVPPMVLAMVFLVIPLAKKT